ncbi:MAG: PIN domain-containing protein [Chloroflexota bacterium]
MSDNPAVSCFIDTNIWLYAFVESDDGAKSAAARSLILQSEPVVSTQILNEICVNLLKTGAFSEDQIIQLVEAFYQKYRVIELNKAILQSASRLRKQYSLSFWDSMVVASALAADVPVLYSEDMQHELMIEQHLQILNPLL